MHRKLALALASSLLLLSWTAPAAAQDSQNLDEAARLTFESAREAFVAGDYETALARFRQAYQLSNRPGLLYNIAQTLDRLRRDAETLQALRDYLEAAPDTPNRAEVEARIGVLERAEAERQAADAERQAAEDEQQRQLAAQQAAAETPAAEEGSGLAILHPAIFISLAGVALAAGGLTVWAGLETTSLNDQYLASTDATAAAALYSDAETMQLMTNIFIASAATFGAAAVACAILTDWDAFGGGDEDQASARVRPMLGAGPDSAFVGARGAF